MGFFGIYGSTAALATTLTLANVVSCIGIGFLRGTHTRRQLVTNNATVAPMLTDMGAVFSINCVVLLHQAVNQGRNLLHVVSHGVGSQFANVFLVIAPRNRNHWQACSLGCGDVHL